MFSESMTKKLVRDLLTEDELENLKFQERGGKTPLVGICDSDTESIFKGFYPINAPIDIGLTVHRVNGELDIFPIVVGG